MYGFNLSSDGFPAIQDVSAPLKEERKPEALKEEAKQDAGKNQHAKTVLREVRVSVKCKGADKRRVDKTLVAHVDRAWSLRRPRPTDVKKRAPCKIVTEKPAKRSKPLVPKVELTAVVETGSVGSVVEEAMEDEPIVEATGAAADVPDAPGQLWNWLEESTYFTPISTRQPLPEDLTLEAEDRLGRSSGVPLSVSASALQTVSEADASNGGWEALRALGGCLVAAKSRLSKVRSSPNDYLAVGTHKQRFIPQYVLATMRTGTHLSRRHDLFWWICLTASIIRLGCRCTTRLLGGQRRRI